jgi:hypothetical protein
MTNEVYSLVANYHLSRHFRNAIRFKLELPFINPSCASFDLVARESDRLVLANTGRSLQTAIFLMTGLVSECHLVTPTYLGNLHTYMARQICIYGFHTEYQRTVAYIGDALNHDSTYYGPLVNGALSFSTRKDTGMGGNVGCVLLFPLPALISHSFPLASPSASLCPGCAALQFRQQPLTSYPGSRGFNKKGLSALLYIGYNNNLVWF